MTAGCKVRVKRRVKPMADITIGAVAYDWFTVVSNDDAFYHWWLKMTDGAEVTPQRWLNRFDGHAASWQEGTLFVGSRKEPVGFMHVAVMTGSLANKMRYEVKESLDLHSAWLSRVDIQMTLPQDGLDLVALFNRLEDGRKRPEILGDRNNGRTVYIGSRKSERFCRVYQKFGDGREKLLRCEFQFGGKQARSYGNALRQGTITPEGSFKGALQQTKDRILMDKYLVKLDGFDPQLPRVVRAETKTDVWLQDVVYPVLMRRLFAHDCPPSLRMLYDWIYEGDENEL